MTREEPFYNARRRLAEKYGPVQRYGPIRVMFSDASAIPFILGTANPIYPKADNHEPPKGYMNGSEVLSFIALRDDDKAARLNRNLHSTFTANGVLEYEAHVDHTVSELVSHLRAAGSATDLAKWMDWFAFDTIARIGFSEDQGLMRHQSDIGGAMQASIKRFQHRNLYWTIPRLEAILFKNWWARNTKRPASGLMRLAKRAIDSRKAAGGLGTHHDLLDLYLASGEKDPELYTPSTIIGITMTTMQAGAETTAYTTAVCMYCLAGNPRVLNALRKEIDSVAPPTASDWQLPPSADLRKLLYLEACIKESQRLWPAINIPSERVVPRGGATIAGVDVPGGTIVAMNTGGLYHNPAIFGDDVNVYRPERWIDASDEQRITMNRANLSFSAGKRMCLGIHVAWLEMRKVVAALVMNFELELAHPERGLKQMPGIFAPPVDVLVRLSPRRIEEW
ncbi:hypothetical protein LTR53_015103 [Teratosphaeriaceae sp. CCFEE 6253]|nr:hypothetical protein LTR53_015103 [Teratosphaeriaceae sp. CCFEE 6253]